MKVLGATSLGIIMFFLGHVPARADTFTEIGEFSKAICDEIQQEGYITRKTIEGILSGKVDGIAKLLGAEVGAEGKVLIDDQVYKGLPYDQLSDQMVDARDCRRELALVLLQGRKEVDDIRKDKKVTVTVDVWPLRNINDPDPNAWMMAPQGSLSIEVEGTGPQIIGPSEWNSLGSIGRQFGNINASNLDSIDVQFSSGFVPDNMGFKYQVSSGSRQSLQSSPVIFGPNVSITNHTTQVDLTD